MLARTLSSSLKRVVPQRQAQAPARCCLSFSSENLGSITVGSPAEDFPDRFNLGRLNNGSFGGVPTCVREYQSKWRSSWESYPDRYYFTGKLHEDIRDAADICADILEIPREETMLIENASVGAVIVAQRWMWKFVENKVQPGDAILMYNHGYAACKKILEYYCARAGAQIIYADLPFPYLNADPYAAVEEAITTFNSQSNGNKVRFAMLDHITSQPAIKFPVADLVALCRSKGVEEVAVDGAHSIGSIENLDISSLDADFFFSNLHKWGLAPHCTTLFHAKVR